MMDYDKLIEALIEKHQAEADDLRKSEQSKYGDDSTVSTYTWVHSMKRDHEKFVAELMDIQTEVQAQLPVPHWISVRDVSDGEICAAKMVLSVIENLDKPIHMYDIEKSAVKKALLLMLRICEAEPPKEEINKNVG